jgi:hypothetical protein
MVYILLSNVSVLFIYFSYALIQPLGMHLPHCAGANGECITSLEGLLEGSLPGSTYSQSNSEVALQGSAPRLRYLHAVEALDRLRR